MDELEIAIDGLAEWSSWEPLVDVAAEAPLLPGVYIARQGAQGAVVYVGMAGERSGGGKPRGLRGRLGVYVSGKGLASGLGEAVFDRALADIDWLRHRVAEVEAATPRRAKEWGRAALAWSNLYVSWTTTSTADEARTLEKRVLQLFGSAEVWNRAR